MRAYGYNTVFFPLTSFTTHSQSNILMSSHDSPKPLLTDFGISHDLSSTTTTKNFLNTDAGQPDGTLRFMAKEMFTMSREHFYTTETDVWAFGMTVVVRLSVTIELTIVYTHHEFLVHSDEESALSLHRQRSAGDHCHQ